MRRLFVYGTLQPGAATPMARWLEARTIGAIPAVVPGQLFAVPDPRGWYPAWWGGGQGKIAGTLLTLDPTAGGLARLDAYEGRDYRRGVMRVRAGAGLVAAQGWRWTRRLPARAVHLPGGDFLGWLATTGFSAFR